MDHRYFHSQPTSLPTGRSAPEVVLVSPVPHYHWDRHIYCCSPTLEELGGGGTVTSALPIITLYRCSCARCQLPACGVSRCFYLLASYTLSYVLDCLRCFFALPAHWNLFLGFLCSEPFLVLSSSPVFCSRTPMTLFFLSQWVRRISPIKTRVFTQPLTPGARFQTCLLMFVVSSW